MASIYDFLTTEASSSATGGVNTAENQDPSTVNDALRAWKQLEAAFVDDLGGVNTVGGTGDAITVTIASQISAYATGLMLTFVAGAANTGATTINVTGASALGAKAIRKISGGTDVALAAGDIAVGRRYHMIYHASANAAAGAFVLLDPGLATATNPGHVELATDAEAQAIADTARAVTPANLAAMVATQANQETGTANDRFVSPGRQQYHPSAAKAFCKVNAAATISGVSFNISSVTDTGVGIATFNFTIAFASTGYVVVAMLMSASVIVVAQSVLNDWASASAARVDSVSVGAAPTQTDPAFYCIAAFGDQ